MSFPLRAALCGGVLASLVAGCAPFSPDGGMSPVAAITTESIGKDVVAIRDDADASLARQRVEQLLRRPLTADAAVQIALLNNRGLQAAYNDLGYAEAAAIGASLPPNPTFSASRIAGPGAFEIEGQIAANILNLATTPLRTEIAAAQFRQAQLAAALETLRIANQTRRAYVNAVSARETAALLAQATSTAEATSQLAAKLNQTGALNTIDRAREQVFYSETRAENATVVLDAAKRREELIRLLGLTDAQLTFRLPGKLPALPPLTSTRIDAETLAIARRVDLQIERIEVETLAKYYGLTNATRFVNLLEVAGVARRTREPGGDPFRQEGFDLQVQIPIFDFGAVKVRQAEARFQAAINRASEKAVNVSSEARAAYLAYRATRDIAGQYQRDVLPLRQTIASQSQVRFGSGQTDIFALLQEARQQIASSRSAIAAKREAWLADADLKAAIFGGGDSSVSSRQISNAVSPAATP